jgi:glutamate synthase domain-containing protein 2
MKETPTELIYSAPAPIDILYELRANRPDLFSKIEIMIDGGVRSGADVVKALALGAKAVGLGRPFLYANGTHGEEGVVRVCQSKSNSASASPTFTILSSSLQSTELYCMACRTRGTGQTS